MNLCSVQRHRCGPTRMGPHEWAHTNDVMPEAGEALRFACVMRVM